MVGGGITGCGAALAAESEGLKVALFRPITISPYPYEALREAIACDGPSLVEIMADPELI